jgi:ketosteroid isomerase-like protein
VGTPERLVRRRIDGVIVPVGGTGPSSPGRTEIQNLVAEGDYVVVQSQASDRVMKTGRPYNNTYCIVFKIAGGKVTEIDEYCDTELITSAFGSK